MSHQLEQTKCILRAAMLQEIRRCEDLYEGGYVAFNVIRSVKDEEARSISEEAADELIRELANAHMLEEQVDRGAEHRMPFNRRRYRLTPYGTQVATGRAKPHPLIADPREEDRR